MVLQKDCRFLKSEEEHMQNIEVEIEGSCIRIDLGEAELDSECLEGRVREILPFLSNLLSADGVWNALSDREQESRFAAYNAQNLICMASLHSAIRHSELLIAVTNGTESIGDHGFPEFASGSGTND